MHVSNAAVDGDLDFQLLRGVKPVVSVAASIPFETNIMNSPLEKRHEALLEVLSSHQLLSHSLQSQPSKYSSWPISCQKILRKRSRQVGGIADW
tara:strand:- start:90 stop:371 length:282 start_codon:yes stop_codon:yes gene_type:complete